MLRARDPKLNRLVAIKVLSPALNQSAAARERFEREARATAAVTHGHVIGIHDVVISDDVSFLVMEYIGGESLKQRVGREGPLDVKDAIQIALNICEGLSEAHRAGLIHRDIKPSNVLLEDSTNRAILCDFGLVRTADDASLTKSGTVAGTPQYMSPEQVEGHAVDERSDLFSVGSVLYFMLAARSPFAANGVIATLNKIGNCRHETLVSYLNGTSTDARLSRFVDELLRKAPDRRIQSAKDAVARLRLLRDHKGDPAPGTSLVATERAAEQVALRDAHRKLARKVFNAVLLGTFILGIALCIVAIPSPPPVEDSTSAVAPKVAAPTPKVASPTAKKGAQFLVKLIDKEIWLRPDGSAKVKQRLTLDFLGSCDYFTLTFRSGIIEDIRVHDAVHGDYEPESSTRVGTCDLQKHARGIQKVIWWCYANQESRSFDIEYVLRDEVQCYGGVGLWEYTVIGSGWQKPIEAVELKIHPPESVEPHAIHAWFNSTRETVEISSDSVISTRMRACEAEDTIHGCFAFPASAFPDAKRGDYELSLANIEADMKRSHDLPVVQVPIQDGPLRVYLPENSRRIAKVVRSNSSNWQFVDENLEMLTDAVLSFVKPLDYETQAETIIRVVEHKPDGEISPTEQYIIVCLVDVDEPPEFDQASMIQAMDFSGKVVTPVAVDPEGGPVRYRMGHDDEQLFKFEEDGLSLRFLGDVHEAYRENRHFVVNLIASDESGLETRSAVFITPPRPFGMDSDRDRAHNDLELEAWLNSDVWQLSGEE